LETRLQLKLVKVVYGVVEEDIAKIYASLGRITLEVHILFSCRIALVFY